VEFPSGKRAGEVDGVDFAGSLSGAMDVIANGSGKSVLGRRPVVL